MYTKKAGTTVPKQTSSAVVYKDLLATIIRDSAPALVSFPIATSPRLAREGIALGDSIHGRRIRSPGTRRRIGGFHARVSGPDVGLTEPREIVCIAVEAGDMGSSDRRFIVCSEVVGDFGVVERPAVGISESGVSFIDLREKLREPLSLSWVCNVRVEI
jgi:hypothetical protein